MATQKAMDATSSKKVNIILTGGHAATPGIAVSEELKSRYPNLRLFWIGSKYAMPGSPATTLEYKIFPEVGVNFYPLIVGKLQTKFTRYTIPLFLGIPLSFFQALWYVVRLRPRVIISFGGFSSFPVIFWGWVMRIPLILHEQTVVAGRASMLSAGFASKITLSRNESLKFFPNRKSVVTGNPMLRQMLDVKPKLHILKEKTILITGGSRGSEFINEEVFKIVPDLTKKYRIVHITGEKDFGKYKGITIRNYKALAFVDPRQIPKYYEEADLVIARSGASTVSEILYTKRPAIFIPLPRTFMDEQSKNAKYAEDFGIAKVLTEKEVAAGLLTKAIDEMFLNWEKIVRGVFTKQSPDLGASQKIADIVEKYI